MSHYEALCVHPMACRKSIAANADSHGAGETFNRAAAERQRHLEPPFDRRSKSGVRGISVFITKSIHCAADVCFWHKADMATGSTNVRFSNRPVGVKRFQAVQRCSVDVARGLALLFGLGTKALPAWGSKTRWNNLLVGLAVGLTVGPSGHSNSPHPSSREGHHSTTRWSSSFLLWSVIAFMPLRPSGSSGTRCRQPRCDA